MAKLYPSLETIKKLTPYPTEGELTCINFLIDTLSDEFEIYFQPYINGDNPDIIIMKKGSGILIIEVKDWDLNNYNVDLNDNWILKQNNVYIKSPLLQVKQYKENLYNLHIPNLLEEKIKNPKIFALINTIVYFHKESESTIKNIINNSDNYIDLLGYDSLTVEKFNSILNKRYLNTKSSFFSNELYDEFNRFLQPTFHTLEKGSEIKYTQKQILLSESKKNKIQKIQGVAGSGKTLVLAKRAVNAYKRTKKRVLILTYNITLKNYIHDNISKVRENFSWDSFYIDNYHNFINSQTNNLNIKINNLSDYDNLDLFKNKNNIIKYDSIFIDEIQDYKIEWIRIIRENFLNTNGEFVVFGDEKQNIYDRKLDEQNKPNTTIPGRWSELNESFRLSHKIARLATRFQNNYFKEKYLIDKIKSAEQQSLFSDENIEYYNFNNQTSIQELTYNIFKIIKDKNIHSNDVCILSSKTAILRSIDYEIRKQEKTKTTFETKDIYKKLQADDTKNLTLELKQIRKNKKFNFWMNPGTSKLSTIHSFKGWEIPTLFLIIDSKESNNELIYTAITRCRYNLFIINIDNPKYNEFFEKSNDIIDIKTNKQLDANEENISNKDIEVETIELVQEQESNIYVPGIIDKLKVNSKFTIGVIGEITENKNKFESELGSFFNKYGVRVNNWNIKFINNNDLKKRDTLKSFRKGGTSYSLLITAGIFKHSSKGNEEENLLTELNKTKYIPHIVGCSPRNKLTVNNFLEKLDEYLHEKINEYIN